MSGRLWTPEPGRPLGGRGELNLPFERDPSGGTLNLGPEDPMVAGAVVVVAVTAPIQPNPQNPKGHTAAGLVFRFTQPDGQFYRPTLLVMEDGELLALPRLVKESARAAVDQARKARLEREVG